MKVLGWLLLGILIFWALRSQARRNLNKRNRTHAAQSGRPAQPPTKPAAQVENMVACAYCQIYLPASEAIHVVTDSSDCYFCSEEHAKLHSTSHAATGTNATKNASTPSSE